MGATFFWLSFHSFIFFIIIIIIFFLELKFLKTHVLTACFVCHLTKWFSKSLKTASCMVSCLFQKFSFSDGNKMIFKIFQHKMIHKGNWSANTWFYRKKNVKGQERGMQVKSVVNIHVQWMACIVAGRIYVKLCLWNISVRQCSFSNSEPKIIIESKSAD